jgi:hypothetical protein
MGVSKEAHEFAEFLAGVSAKSATPGLDLAVIRDVVDSNHKASTEPEGVTYAEVAPFVREAFERLGTKSDALLLANFVPCVLPELEGRMLSHTVTKLLWLAGQGFAYALRPLLVHPKKPSAAELLNFALQLGFNVGIFYLWGGKALAYLPVSSLIVMGLHPIAGHYISEHYVFRDGQETYSYYGPLNRLAFNVGYHNEHHDFPYIPGSRLAQLRATAPEFYDTLHAHRSWAATLWRFVTEPQLGGYSRIKRRRDSAAG